MIFLLEIEVWEIWDPPAILKFNIVLKPNNLGKNKKQVMDWEKLKNYKESFGKPSENMVKVMKSIQNNLIKFIINNKGKAKYECIITHDYFAFIKMRWKLW